MKINEAQSSSERTKTVEIKRGVGLIRWTMKSLIKATTRSVTPGSGTPEIGPVKACTAFLILNCFPVIYLFSFAKKPRVIPPINLSKSLCPQRINFCSLETHTTVYVPISCFAFSKERRDTPKIWKSFFLEIYNKKGFVEFCYFQKVRGERKDGAPGKAQKKGC